MRLTAQEGKPAMMDCAEVDDAAAGPVEVASALTRGSSSVAPHRKALNDDRIVKRPLNRRLS